MVDEVRVLRLLRALDDELGLLAVEAVAPDDRRRDPLWLRGIKFAFVTCVEVVVDVAQHLCAAEGWGPPSDNGAAVRLLGARGVLPPALADRLVLAVGFRNVLVHEYVEVDDALVEQRLEDLSDLTAFVKALAGWLRRPE